MCPDAVERASRMARDGDVRGALAVLAKASDRGDAKAAAELGFWYLRGGIVERDIGLARRHLRRATDLGNVDAALIEIALTGSGSGSGNPDWSAAMRLLARLARTEEWARREFNLVGGLEIDDVGFPKRMPKSDQLDVRLKLRRFPDFLSPEERKHIAGVASHTLEPSTVFDPVTGRQMENPIRTSHGTVIGPAQEDLVFQAIYRRIAVATGTRFEQGEPLSVLRYSPGQHYKLHYDAITGSSNNRVKTVLLYLNDGYDGGETIFPELGLTFGARAGDALVFDGLTSAGAVDPLSRHAGLPVKRGTKWIATRWIRQRPFDPWAKPTR